MVHFDIVGGVLVIFDIDIEADAFAVVLMLERLFFLDVAEVPDLDSQDLFDHAFADMLVFHDELEQIIISDIQLIPGLTCSRCYSSFIIP